MLKLHIIPDVKNRYKNICKCLKANEYQQWKALAHKGRGAFLFSEWHSVIKKLNNLEVLTYTDYKAYLKLELRPQIVI